MALVPSASSSSSSLAVVPSRGALNVLALADSEDPFFDDGDRNVNASIQADCQRMVNSLNSETIKTARKVSPYEVGVIAILSSVKPKEKYGTDTKDPGEACKLIICRPEDMPAWAPGKPIVVKTDKSIVCGMDKGKYAQFYDFSLDPTNATTHFKIVQVLYLLAEQRAAVGKPDENDPVWAKHPPLLAEDAKELFFDDAVVNQQIRAACTLRGIPKRFTRPAPDKGCTSRPMGVDSSKLSDYLKDWLADKRVVQGVCRLIHAYVCAPDTYEFWAHTPGDSDAESKSTITVSYPRTSEKKPMPQPPRDRAVVRAVLTYKVNISLQQLYTADKQVDNDNVLPQVASFVYWGDSVYTPELNIPTFFWIKDCIENSKTSVNIESLADIRRGKYVNGPKVSISYTPDLCQGHAAMSSLLSARLTTGQPAEKMRYSLYTMAPYYEDPDNTQRTPRGASTPVIRHSWQLFGQEVWNGPLYYSNGTSDPFVYINTNVKSIFATYEIPENDLRQFGITSESNLVMRRHVTPLVNNTSVWEGQRTAYQPAVERAGALYRNLYGRPYEGEWTLKWTNLVQQLEALAAESGYDGPALPSGVFAVKKAIGRDAFFTFKELVVLPRRADYVCCIDDVHVDVHVPSAIARTCWPVSHAVAKQLEIIIAKSKYTCGEAELADEVVLINKRASETGKAVQSMSADSYRFYVLGIDEKYIRRVGLTTEDTDKILCQDYYKACASGKHMSYLASNFAEHHSFVQDPVKLTSGPSQHFLLYAVPVDAEKCDFDVERFASLVEWKPSARHAEALLLEQTKSEVQSAVASGNPDEVPDSVLFAGSGDATADSEGKKRKRVTATIKEQEDSDQEVGASNAMDVDAGEDQAEADLEAPTAKRPKVEEVEFPEFGDDATML